MSALLPILLAVPIAAAVVVALLGPRRRDAVWAVSLVATLAAFLIAAVLALNLHEVRAGATGGDTFAPEFVTRFDLLSLGDPDDRVPRPAIQFYVGLDGLNVWLVALTALLMVSAVLTSYHVTERVNEYYAWLLALETGMIGVFLAFDLVLFYVFFELTLVPLFFLIGIWGGPQRQYAARKFFVYTLAGSLITLLGMLGVVLTLYTLEHKLTFSIPELIQLVNQRLNDPMTSSADRAFWGQVQFWVFLALIVGFSIKVPLVPVHTWLPLAHVEAPTAGSVLLAGVLLKIGSYGFLRLCLPLTPDAAYSVGVPLIGTLAVIGIIYGSFCALAQDDIKKMVAYSSVAHMGFCMLGLFALNEAGLSGGLLTMINHGLSTGALFLLVGMFYERYHTRMMDDYGGMSARLGLLSLAFVFITLTSIGLPGLNGFVGEVLVMTGMFQTGRGTVFAVLATTGVVLGAWYMLTMVKRVLFGPLKEPHHEGHVGDLNLREFAALMPIAVMCVWLGVYPQPFLDVARPDLEVVTRITKPAEERAARANEERSGALARKAPGEDVP